MINERFSKILLWLGVILFVIGIVCFLWKDKLFDTSLQVNSEKLGQLGSLFSGLIGTIWSLAGVILFYIALTEQRKDIKINQDALKMQVAALNQQIKEFELQRDELEQTRKVFIEQSETLKIQRFENTFFQLLTLFHEIVDKLTFTPTFEMSFAGHSPKNYEKREVLSRAVSDLSKSLKWSSGNYVKEKGVKIEDRTIEDLIAVLDIGYHSFYYTKYKQLLSHYYRNIYHIFKFIYTTDLVEKDKKQFYATLLRAQLSSDELFLILYNSLVEDFGYPKFLFLINEYDIMQNFDFDFLVANERHIEVYEYLLDNLPSEI